LAVLAVLGPTRRSSGEQRQGNGDGEKG